MLKSASGSNAQPSGTNPEHGYPVRFSTALRALAVLAPLTFSGCTALTPHQDPLAHRPSPTTQPLPPGRHEEIRDRIDFALDRLSNGASPVELRKEFDAKDLQDLTSYLLGAARGTEPHTLRAIARYHGAVALLRELLGSELPQDVSDRSRELMARHVETFGTWSTKVTAFDEFDVRMRALARIAAVSDDAGRASCFAALNRLEAQLRELPDSALTVYADEQVARVQALDDYRLKAELRPNTMTIGGSKVSSGEFESIKLEAKNGWSREGDSWIFTDSKSREPFKRWELQISHFDTPDDLCLTLRNAADHSIFVRSDYGRFADHNRKGTLAILTAEALTSHLRETDPKLAALEESFDFGTNGPIVHQRVFPRAYDFSTGSTILSSCIWARALEHNYPERLRSEPCMFTDTPLEDLRVLFERRHAEGARCFVIDFLCHGEPEQLDAGKALTAKDLVVFFKRFPDSQFVVITDACYGGGLQPGIAAELKRHRDLGERVSIVTQTKPTIPNELSTMKLVEWDRDEALHNSGARFYLYGTQRFFKGPGIKAGAVFRAADLEVKKHWNFDAEVLLNGELLSRIDSNDVSSREG